MKHQPMISHTGTQALVTDVFGELSREELLMALSLMHQIIDADRKGDVEHIVTALSKLRREATGSKLTPRHTPNESHRMATPRVQGNYSHRVVRYFFSCLAKMQTRLDAEPSVRFHVGGIFEKLDVTSRTQAVARALGAGLIAS
jgi:hypothetical protein